MHFQPNAVAIAVGGTVTWSFAGNYLVNFHDIHGNGFDSGGRMGAFSYSHTFTQAGSYSYTCTVGHFSPPGAHSCPPFMCCMAIHHETGIVDVYP